MDIRDYGIAFGVGVVSSVLWFFVLQHLSFSHEGAFAASLALLPLLCVGIVTVAHRRFRGDVLPTIAKFLVVGVLNTGIDFFVFDTLIVSTGISRGWPILAFKSFSFLCALLNSYELNRLWTFQGEAMRRRTRREFALFAAVTIVGLCVNVATTAFVIGATRPLLGLSQIRWDNVAAVLATLLSVVWNFIGYRLFVFNARRHGSNFSFSRGN